MPYIKIETNVAVKDKKDFLNKVTKKMASATGKAEAHVMVKVSDNNAMLFSGSNDSLAFCEVKSIGMSESQAPHISAELCGLIEAELDISQDRIFIEFASANAKMWGFNGSTLG